MKKVVPIILKLSDMIACVSTLFINYTYTIEAALNNDLP